MYGFTCLYVLLSYLWQHGLTIEGACCFNGNHERSEIGVRWKVPWPPFSLLARRYPTGFA